MLAPGHIAAAHLFAGKGLPASGRSAVRIGFVRRPTGRRRPSIHVCNTIWLNSHLSCISQR